MTWFDSLQLIKKLTDATVNGTRPTIEGEGTLVDIGHPPLIQSAATTYTIHNS